MGLLAAVAFVVDLGYIMIAKADLQRAADAAARAGAMQFSSEGDTETVHARVRTKARDYVRLNKVLHSSAEVQVNSGNADPQGDLLVGTLDFQNPGGPLSFDDPAGFNAVRVRVRRSGQQNGSVSLFLGRLFGWNSISLEATATAAVISRVSGFRTPGSKKNVPVLPIAIKKSHWEEMLSDGDRDDYSWSDGQISSGSDGIPEISIFPVRTRSGNFGTVNIGHSSNSTKLLADQVRNGLSPADLDYHGGELKLDGSGELELKGNPGLSASLKDDLQAIAGQPRIIPLYSKVRGNGANTVYTIVGWVGARIMNVQLTGKNKSVVVQPATIKARGVITGGDEASSSKIFSPAVLVN